jgi:GT2 family glycosyltransferase
MRKSRVSIVIVNWKTPDLLSSCLDSVLADTNSASFDIWVVDNASGDDSLEILSSRFPTVNVIANDANVGFARACNQAFIQVKGNYILLLNPDTLVVGDAVSAMQEYLDTHRACGAVGPKVLNMDGTLQLACRRAFPSPKAAFFRLTYLSRLFPNHPTFAQYNLTYADPGVEMEVDALSGACMMVRRRTIERVGLLDEAIFMFGEDIDWCWRFKQAGWTVNYLPSAVVFHHHGASSRLRPVGATINLHKGMEVFYRKHLAPNYPAPFNWLVYAAIWSRGGLFVALATIKGAFIRQAPKALTVESLNVQAASSQSDEKHACASAGGRRNQ